MFKTTVRQRNAFMRFKKEILKAKFEFQPTEGLHADGFMRMKKMKE